jgi:hypothetical protein
MLKKAVRLGTLMVLVLIFSFNVAGVKADREDRKTNLVPVIDGTMSYGDVYGVPWNGSYNPGTWDTSKLYPLNFVTDAKTYGDLKAEYESKLGYPIVMLAKVYDIAYISIGAGISWSPLGRSAPFYYIMPDPSDPLVGWQVSVAIFKAPAASENVRLTLFGYVNDDSKSCVLWSLEGWRPVNVDSKCGGGSELVCTVKLVEKKLKYDCEGGYDWLGEQIVNNPQWSSWADKFASMNGHK